jgi:hypothetical protein
MTSSPYPNWAQWLRLLLLLPLLLQLLEPLLHTPPSMMMSSVP